MAKRLQFCAALLLSVSAFVTGCTVDVEDPSTEGGDSSQSGAPPVSTNTAPVIQLVGEPVITISVGSSFIDPGVVASDVEDGDLTGAVYSNSVQVNSNRTGQYEITYRVSDSGNLAAQPVKRTVIVSAPLDEVPTSQPVGQLPAIAAARLVGFTAAREMVDLLSIENGSVIDLSQTSIDLLNVVADLADTGKAGSVHFKLAGPISVDRWENSATYTMVVDTVNLSVSKSQLPVGDYTLTITPYSLPDMAGNKGVAKTVAFKVVDNKIISSVPKIAAVDLVSVTDGTGAYVAIARISEGMEINLADIKTKLVNVIAVSEDASKTGSVHFSLAGPVDLDRAENNAVYALANEKQHLDISKHALPVGDYSLIVTPYAEADTKGEAGIPLLVNFTVVGAPGEPEAPIPTASEPMAVADDYTFQAGSGGQPGQVQPVSANDRFESGAVFSVIKEPSNGSVRMYDAGFFTYTPNVGFAGADTFTYQIIQAGKTSSASVTVNVVAPVAGADTGFTVIKPSKDSKLVYVSSSSGSDANSCLSASAPCKTIGAGLEKMRNGFPDHLYLKRGDVWRDERLINLHSGRSAQEPAVISSYGESGPRPKIENSTAGLNIYKGAMKNFSFVGLEFASYKMVPGSADFTGDALANITLLGANENILFEDNKFTYAEVTIQSWNGGIPVNITFKRNIWTGAYYNKSSFDRNKRPSNIYADGVVGLTLDENVFDYGGWNPEVAGAGANMFNHNVYLQHGMDATKIKIRRNIFSRASSHGIQMRSGGTADDNFFGRNAIGLVIGMGGGEACVVNNVVTEGQSMVKGDNACSSASLCTSAVWGIHFSMADASGWFAHNNVVNLLASGDQWKGKYSKLVLSSFKFDAGAPGAEPSNNVSWHWANAVEGDDKNYQDPGRTLGAYYDHLVKSGQIKDAVQGEDSFDKFMNLAKSRQPGVWPSYLTARSINNFIREGYGISGGATCNN